jgi:RNA polymerase subunit RPABC4/transcription elongation factor Spt4
MPTEEGVAPKRICPQCKRLLDAEWVACPYCGRNIPSERGVKLPPICPHCKRLLKDEWKTCPYCGGDPAQPPRYESVTHYDQPSLAWYLAPLLFGIVGGLIGYVGTKDRDQNMASNLLIFGIIWSFVLFLIGWALIT